ncbi:hypothetical protein BH10ACI3_BH10ACI3_09380 [soil metagenome]
MLGGKPQKSLVALATMAVVILSSDAFEAVSSESRLRGLPQCTAARLASSKCVPYPPRGYASALSPSDLVNIH